MPVRSHGNTPSVSSTNRYHTARGGCTSRWYSGRIENEYLEKINEIKSDHHNTIYFVGPDHVIYGVRKHHAGDSKVTPVGGVRQWFRTEAMAREKNTLIAAVAPSEIKLKSLLYALGRYRPRTYGR